jgi:hypothetical protein
MKQEILEKLKTLPQLYTNESVLAENVLMPVKLKIMGFSWYPTEFDGKDIMFGFANLADDQMAELGYFKISEMELAIQDAFDRTGCKAEIELELNWNETTTLKDVMEFRIR